MLRLWRVGRCFARYDIFRDVAAGYDLPLHIKFALWVVQLGVTPLAAAKGQPFGQRLAAAFEALGPAFIKLGQAIATRPDAVGTDMAGDLMQLQDAVTPFDGAAAVEAIEAEMGAPLGSVYAAFDMDAVAAASVSQVHRAETIDGAQVAVKVLRPGVERLFAADLATFAWAARQMERWVPRARRLRPTAVVDTLAQSVADELDLRIEAAHASELADSCAGIDGYRVPQIDWERSGKTVMTLEWVDGMKPLSAKQLEKAGIDPVEVSTRLVQMFLRQAMHHGFFHADCHHGNLLIEPDGTIAALDFGIMGRLDEASRRTLALILNGFLSRDYKQIAKLHFQAGYVDPDQSLDAFASSMRAIGEPITGKPLQSISVAKLLTQLLATTERYSMRTQPQLIMLQKTMVMVEGLAYSLNPNLNMWETARPVIEDWARDNLSPEVVVADALAGLYNDVKALPGQLERVASGLEAQAAPRAASNAIPGPMWFVLGILAALAFLT